MSVQAQSFSGSTSHLPSLVPPQGPLRMPLWQRAIGQIPPVISSRQSPQRRHFSSNWPTRRTLPRKSVSFAGKTGFSVPSRADWHPAPQDMTRTALAFSSLSLWARNSFDVELVAPGFRDHRAGYLLALRLELLGHLLYLVLP